MAPCPVLVIPILNGFGGDGRHGAQIRKHRPETVVDAHVGGMELFGAGCPKALAGVVEIPEVEVADLCSLDGDDAADLTCLYLPRASAADGDDELV